MKSVLAMISMLFLAAPAGAADPTKGWLERAGAAEQVVVAECQSQESRWENGRIFTYSELAIEQTVRGAAHELLTIRQPGGIVGDVGQRVTHTAAILEPRTRYLLFLDRDEAGELMPTEVGANAISRDEAGAELLPTGESLRAVVRTLEQR